MGADLQFQSNNIPLHPSYTIYILQWPIKMSHFKQFDEITNRKSERKMEKNQLRLRKVRSEPKALRGHN